MEIQKNLSSNLQNLCSFEIRKILQAIWTFQNVGQRAMFRIWVSGSPYWMKVNEFVRETLPTYQKLGVCQEQKVKNRTLNCLGIFYVKAKVTDHSDNVTSEHRTALYACLYYCRKNSR